MKFLEYGNCGNEKIILIHGANIPWQMWLPQIEHFSKKYFIIVPALDGHIADDNSIFQSVQNSAQEIEKYYIEHYGKKIFAVCGMSMGGTIGAILWQNGNLQIRKLILESAPLVPMNSLIMSINTKQNIKATHKAKERDGKYMDTFKKMFPENLLTYFFEMIDSMDDKTVRNCSSSFGRYCLPTDLDTTGMDIAFFYGTVFMELMAKKSAKYLRKYYPQAKIKCFHGYNHCELSVNRPKQYIKEVEKILPE